MTKAEILATTKELANSLANSQEYRALKDAEAELKAHAAAQIMWEDLEKKQRSCYEPGLSEEEIKTRFEDVQKTFELVSHNPHIRQFLLAQMEFGQLWEEIQKTLAEAIGIKTGKDEPPDEES